MITFGVTDYTKQTPSKHFTEKKCLSSRPPKMKNKIMKCYKIGGAQFQCMNNHYAKFEYRGRKTVGVPDYTNQTPPHPFAFRIETLLSSKPVINVKIFIKCAQNKSCTSSMCDQSLCKV